MKDISEKEAALLMIEMKLQLLEVGLSALNKIIDECAQTVDQMEKAIKENYGSSN
jgi:prefoldin subunit 5